MIEVKHKENYMHLFNEYTHNIPVIYSCLEGQYDGELFVDSEIEPQIAILFTSFGFHFVAGNAEKHNVVESLDEILFKQYLINTGQVEAIVFGPNEKWDKVLDEVFAMHRGIKGSRQVFRLDREKFAEVQDHKKTIEAIENRLIENRLIYEKENASNRQYPVSRILIDGKCVSFCSGFMLGKGHAEIDVATEEAFRGKGYAKDAAIALISELLKNEIEPDWCTWPYRTESQILARSLGYELEHEIPAHIWIEEECGKL